MRRYIVWTFIVVLSCTALFADYAGAAPRNDPVLRQSLRVRDGGKPIREWHHLRSSASRSTRSAGSWLGKGHLDRMWPQLQRYTEEEYRRLLERPWW